MLPAQTTPQKPDRIGLWPVPRMRPLLVVLLAYTLAVAALVAPAGRLAAMPGGAPEWCRGDVAGEPDVARVLRGDPLPKPQRLRVSALPRVSSRRARCASRTG